QQLSLWNQMGSKVILGNLLVIPIEDSLLYVEPLYIRAQNGQLPELKRVLASYSDRTVMGDNLELTLAALFEGQEGVSQPAVVKLLPTAENQLAVTRNREIETNRTGQSAPALISASDHYDRALQALRTGDWTQFGAEMQKLGTALRQPEGNH